jgi:hypothetical protein
MRTVTWNAPTDATLARWRAEREARHGRITLASDLLAASAAVESGTYWHSRTDEKR